MSALIEQYRAEVSAIVKKALKAAGKATSNVGMNVMKLKVAIASLMRQQDYAVDIEEQTAALREVANDLEEESKIHAS